MSSERDVERARTLAILALGLWFCAALVVGALGHFARPNTLGLLLGFLLVPIVGFATAYAASRSFRGFADRIGLTVLVGSHLWRFVGVVFIVAWRMGALPAGFAIPEGIGDIIAAMGALLLLPSIRHGTVSRGWLLAWNIFGLLDLVSALTMGVLYSNSALGVLAPGTVTSRFMVTFPVSLIPTFFVPLFILMHLLTFKRAAHLPSHPRRAQPRMTTARA